MSKDHTFDQVGIEGMSCEEEERAFRRREMLEK